ncbi:flagellin [Lysinibacillus sp. NPDC047702]|uniref:flagellin n=1 Tax=Lysinibacillus sp. NPDC047702 TaxID=3390573 RepID=UPI003CFD99D7
MPFAANDLRDVDMANEINKLNKDRILLQSSQAMMAQINQMSQGVLKLLGNN